MAWFRKIRTDKKTSVGGTPSETFSVFSVPVCFALFLSTLFHTVKQKIRKGTILFEVEILLLGLLKNDSKDLI
jgi:hypothetical protein